MKFTNGIRIFLKIRRIDIGSKEVTVDINIHLLFFMVIHQDYTLFQR